MCAVGPGQKTHTAYSVQSWAACLHHKWHVEYVNFGCHLSYLQAAACRSVLPSMVLRADTSRTGMHAVGVVTKDAVGWTHSRRGT